VKAGWLAEGFARRELHKQLRTRCAGRLLEEKDYSCENAWIVHYKPTPRPTPPPKQRVIPGRKRISPGWTPLVTDTGAEICNPSIKFVQAQASSESSWPVSARATAIALRYEVPSEVFCSALGQGLSPRASYGTDSAAASWAPSTLSGSRCETGISSAAKLKTTSLPISSRIFLDCHPGSGKPTKANGHEEIKGFSRDAIALVSRSQSIAAPAYR